MASYRWFAVCLLALAAGCASTWPVDSFEAPGADLAARRTFMWTGGELGTVVDVDPSVAAETDQHIRAAVVTGLTQKGYTEVSDEKSAQMLVSYQVVGTRKIITSKRPRFTAPLPDSVLMQSNAPPPAASEMPREQTVRDGSVIVFVSDGATSQLLWRGMVTAETRASSNRSAIDTAAEMARDIVDTFPSRTGSR
jgi:Domain of unknown function (DUF4136)